MADSGEEPMIDTETSEKIRSRKKRGAPLLAGNPKRVHAKWSTVWTHFVRSQDDVEKCICNYCDHPIKCTIATGTSAMTKHLERCKMHQNHLSVESHKQKVLASDGKGSSSLVAWRFNQVKCRRAYVMMIILDKLPFSFVDHLGFRLFVTEACPSFIIPSRFTIARDVMDMFISEKAGLKSILCKQRVSLTTDIWTSITTVSYMVITAHFIDESWQLKRMIIGFSPVSNHKGLTIAKKLEACLLDWGIEKICTISVDNASANDCAVKIVRNRLMTWGANALVLGGDFLHIRCCAHILNLVVRDGLSKKRDSVAGVRNAVKYIRSSSSRLEAFQKKASEEEATRGNLILDCGTRWNSTYLMLEAALKFRKAFERMAEEDKLFADHFEEEDIVTGTKRVGPPSVEDWENAERMVKFLKTFYDSTLIFSASKKVTSSGCYNEICKISTALKVMVANPDQSWSDMGKTMVEKFNKYWEGLEKINKILIVACVLDPRRKVGFVMHCLEKIYGKDNPKCSEIKDGVLKLLQKLFDVYHAEYTLFSGVGNESKDAADLVGSDEEDDPFGEWGKMSMDSGVVAETKNELQMYLLDKIEPPVRNALGLDSDLLMWWRSNSLRYPVLARIARDILAIPVSTVASESAFSTGGRILDQYRSSLTHKTVEALILTQN